MTSSVRRKSSLLTPLLANARPLTSLVSWRKPSAVWLKLSGGKNLLWKKVAACRHPPRSSWAKLNSEFFYSSLTDYIMLCFSHCLIYLFHDVIFSNSGFFSFFLFSFRLANEAARQRQAAMDLDRRIQALRTGRPMKEAADKEAEARRMRQEVEQLQRAAVGEEEDAQRKRSEAERMAQAAEAKVHEADEIAKKYWAARDEAKRLDDQAKTLAAEAAEEAKDARNKRVTVDRLGQRVAKASTEAERALQRKAELEQQAQELAGEKESAVERAGRLEREAEERRRAAGQHEEEARKKVQEAERVTVKIPDVEGARKRAEEARKAAKQARAREGGLTAEVERLEAIARKAEEEATAKAEELRSMEGKII